MNLVNLVLVYFLIVVTFYSVRKSFRHTENNVKCGFCNDHIPKIESIFQSRVQVLYHPVSNTE